MDPHDVFAIQKNVHSLIHDDMHVTVDIYAQAFFIFIRSFKKERIGNMWFYHKSINGENAECKKVYILLS